MLIQFLWKMANIFVINYYPLTNALEQLVGSFSLLYTTQFPIFIAIPQPTSLTQTFAMVKSSHIKLWWNCIDARLNISTLLACTHSLLIKWNFHSINWILNEMQQQQRCWWISLNFQLFFVQHKSSIILRLSCCRPRQPFLCSIEFH